MTKLEIDIILAQQIHYVQDLIECMPTPELWHASLNDCLQKYYEKNYVNPDPGINYLRSGIREFIFRLVRFSRTLGLPEFVQTRARVINPDLIIEQDLDTILSNDWSFVKIYPKHTIEKIRDCQEQIDGLPKITVKEQETCECGGQMISDFVSGSLSCSSCGLSQDSVIGMFLEDRSLGSDSSAKSKSNSHKTSKHFETWMSRIMAIEHRPDIHVLVSKIRDHFRETRVPRDLIDYKSIRKYLQDTGNAFYYENIAWLLKEVTGRSPPNLTEEEKNDIAYRFDIIINSFDRIRKDTEEQPQGRTYYPFFIYKIIEAKFANKPEKLRLLDYIHIQQEKTLLKNEQLYKRILEHAKNSRIMASDP